MSEKKKKSYINGAIIIAFGGLFSKFLGIFFKIPISNILGSYGLGLYSYAYPLYNAFLAISTVGLPVAVSKMVSERISLGREEDARNVFKVARTTLFALGLFASLVMFFGAKLFIKVLQWDPNAYYSIATLAIAPVFVATMSAYRGYFQGMQRMSVSSISQILEQIARVSVGVILAKILSDKLGVIYGAAGAVFGAVAGAIVSFVFLFFSNILYQSRNKRALKLSKPASETADQILKKILIIAVPITVGGLITTSMDLINSATISSGLQSIGYTQESATELLGILEQRAQTLINVPIVLGASLSQSLVPAISASVAREDFKMARNKASMAIKIASLVAFPCAVGLYILSEPILSMLFGTGEGSKMLSLLAISVIPTILMTSLQGILQGAGKYYAPIINLGIGTVVKLVLNIVLLRQESLNIYGAIISTIAATLVICILNLIAVIRYIGIGKVTFSVIKVALISVFMGLTTSLLYSNVSMSHGTMTSTLISIVFAVILYASLILLSSTFTKKDFKSIRE